MNRAALDCVLVLRTGYLWYDTALSQCNEIAIPVQKRYSYKKPITLLFSGFFSVVNFSVENFSVENFSVENFSVENFSVENFLVENFLVENFSGCCIAMLSNAASQNTVVHNSR